ncbi:MAG: VWA domain-containing protein [Pyrinomonadaceae bacterium]
MPTAERVSQRPRTRARVPLLVLAAALASLATCAPSAARARRVNEPAVQQRPRRVGSEAATTAARPSPVQPGTREEVDDGDVVRVDTQLVSVPVVVTDGAGRALTGLRAEDFLLFEDGRPQKIASFATTDAPFEVALLLDTSGSTREEMSLIRRAAFAFIKALRPDDRVAVLAFNNGREGRERVAVVEVKTPLTNDRDELQAAVESIGASNGTPFYDGLEAVAREVFREKPREGASGRRALVALTDGVDSASESDFGTARATLKRAGLVSYFIQVNTEDYVEEGLIQSCEGGGSLRLSRKQLERYRRLVAPGTDAEEFADFCRMGPLERMHANGALYDLARREMEALARDSGGRNFPVADLREACGALRRVAEEIGTQYSLGYYPTNKARDGAYRNIRVQARGVGDARVRAREGYRAPKG